MALMYPAPTVYMKDLKKSRKTKTAYRTVGSSISISTDMTIHRVVHRARGITEGIKFFLNPDLLSEGFNYYIFSIQFMQSKLLQTIYHLFLKKLVKYCLTKV